MKVGANRLHRTFTRANLRGTLEGRHYSVLELVLLFVGSIIDQSAEHERVAPMTRVDTWYARIIADTAKDMGKRA